MSFLSSFLGTRAKSYDCKQVGKLLQEYLDDQLNEAVRAKMQTHLMMCADCGLEYTTFLQLKHALADRRNALPEDAIRRLQQFSTKLAEQSHDHPDEAD